MDDKLSKPVSDKLDATSATDQQNPENNPDKSQPKPSNDPSRDTLLDAVDSDTYNMNHKYRGKCLIFNNKVFDKHTNLPTRDGSDVDAANLYLRFRDLGFHVTVHANASKSKIFDVLKEAGSEDHSNNDCFACVILSHGDEGVIYGRDGKFPTDLIFKPFLKEACRTLERKPKLFFIQACQGTDFDSGFPLRTCHDGTEVLKIPNQEDFFVACSTVPGFYSWRHTIRGSWFIQALCHVFENYAEDKELVEMLTVVNRLVAYYFESNTPDEPLMHGKKQVSCFSSRLIKKVYFPSK